MSEEKDIKTCEVGAAAKKPSGKRCKRLIMLGIVAAVIVVSGAGFWVWHEQPSFCNAICHAPQDPINETYDGVSGQAGFDKWGNPVEDMGDLLVVRHKEAAGATCLSCHVPTIGQQITEGVLWVSGNYRYPLEERSLTDLNHYLQAKDESAFCMNDRCHNMTRDDLARATAKHGKRNPHVTEAKHTEMECSDCHKSHRQSVNACSRCHDDVKIPDGWLSAEEAAKITSAGFRY
ncbi:salivary glue protein Sgs-3 [Eggerthellaceae bacterium zg-1084]|uniref:Salivary glue protein Sgs-3 n=1 Tax=Berryella wangjianweii TaxID=2734634 RepID=A0A6M8IWJ7_9ACTN|nr:cytochrome c3 family protein [Berryella wangjianweii]NPD30393.1 salivary glue protein Sgs-3 [Berryella wangjianweii]NPD32701.1 salivary glue protein Sgs-3 [Eggerthellaceae bacterium zg-997]QKF07075.1 salivary glue protein Sgs-3 [Berryella wangjianweii]